MVRSFVEECKKDSSKLLTGYQLINEFSDKFYPKKKPLQNETTDTKGNLSEILGYLFKKGELSNAFCDKIVENDDCPLEFKSALKKV